MCCIVNQWNNVKYSIYWLNESERISQQSDYSCQFRDRTLTTKNNNNHENVSARKPNAEEDNERTYVRTFERAAATIMPLIDKKWAYNIYTKYMHSIWTGLNINLKYRLLGSFSVRLVFLCCYRICLLHCCCCCRCYYSNVNLTNGVVVFMRTYVPFSLNLLSRFQSLARSVSFSRSLISIVWQTNVQRVGERETLSVMLSFQFGCIIDMLERWVVVAGCRRIEIVVCDNNNNNKNCFVNDENGWHEPHISYSRLCSNRLLIFCSFVHLFSCL